MFGRSTGRAMTDSNANGYNSNSNSIDRKKKSRIEDGNHVVVIEIGNTDTGIEAPQAVRLLSRRQAFSTTTTSCAAGLMSSLLLIDPITTKQQLQQQQWTTKATTPSSVLSSLFRPPPAHAVGPVKITLLNPTYTAIPCPRDRPIPGEKAMKGMRGLCVTVNVELEESPDKPLEKVGVYGFVTDRGTGESVLANNPDLSTDAGQFAMVESVKPTDKKITFEFIAAVPSETVREVIVVCGIHIALVVVVHTE